MIPATEGATVALAALLAISRQGLAGLDGLFAGGGESYAKRFALPVGRCLASGILRSG